ncbi:MAG: helix-turn-helix domain-containing protein [Nitrososphaerota archaeon]|nr:helix-turn-helix domain-containing protein [Nitrososphaerota archaeon]
MRVSYVFSHDACWVCNLTRHLGVDVRVLSRRFRKGQVNEDVEISADSATLVDEALERLKKHQGAALRRLTFRSDDGRYAVASVAFQPAGGCPMASFLASTSGHPAHVSETSSRGNLNWNLELDDSRAAKRMERLIRAELSAADVKVRAQRGRKPSPRSAHLLKTAFERGCFDVPRRMSLHQLAQQMNTPISTLDINLRRALKRHLQRTLE